MSAASTSIVTYAILGGDATKPQNGSIISANPTATALMLNCATTEIWCRIPTLTITIGPWAQASPPASASTGTFDMTKVETVGPEDGSPGSTITMTTHCDMTSTLTPAVCTTAYFQDPSLHATSSGGLIPSEDLSLYTFAPQPITVTAGLEKLAVATTTAPPDASSAGPSTTAAITSTHTAGANTPATTGMGIVGLIGLAAVCFDAMNISPW
ncbi:hypothetical protein ANO11243_050940 [Dothideomycetidae sp. 11243]|nr:hypothetical protein ANO11243_050940 [fungal sp. No.11243]